MKKWVMMSLLMPWCVLGMHVQRTSSGNMFHMMVALNDDERVIQLLEKMTPDQVNEQTTNGSTALHIAVGPITALEYRQVEKKLAIIKALFAKGADKTIRDRQGMTAYDRLNRYGLMLGKPQMLTLFEQYN